MTDEVNQVDVEDPGLFDTLKSVAPPTLVQSAFAGAIALIANFSWWLAVVLLVPFAIYVLFNFFIISVTVLYEILLFAALGAAARDTKQLSAFEKLRGLSTIVVRSTIVVFLIQSYLLILTILVGHFILS